MREAEERSRRETQAAEARWRHELEVSEQRRAQEKADLEERTRRETKAAEARLRQEAEAAERRRAQEAADLEEMMRNLAMAPPSYSGGDDDYDYQDYDDDDEGVNYYTVVSGGTYTLCYKDQNLYATLDRDGRHSEHPPMSLRGLTSDESF
jgi:membrane protein involved in colicin uptake